MPNNCAGCAFWVWDQMGPDYREGAPDTSDLPYMSGQCRRRAPVLQEHRFDPGGTGHTARQWPLTRGSDFCGEYEAGKA